MYDAVTDTPEAKARRANVPDRASLAVEVRIASTQREVVACQYLIANVYNGHYSIVFSRHGADPHAKIEPYPRYYVMGLVEDKLVAAAGLYVGDTYVERFGGVTEDEVRAELARAGLPDPRGRLALREYTKLVVHSDFHGYGLGRMFFALSHSKDFLNLDGAGRPLIVCCAKRTVFENLYDVSRIATRPIKPFPMYRVHERYASADDPMDSRLIIPELDIHPRWYDSQLPITVPLENLRSWRS